MTLQDTKARLTLGTPYGRALALVFAAALGGVTSWKAMPTAFAAPESADSKAARGCLAAGNGYLRARIRGAMNLDVDWRNADLECDGGPRPDGNGIRLSFAGPVQTDGRRLRMVFGVAHTGEGNAGSALPTNLTVIFEGEKRLFATRGDDKCTVDSLHQERLEPLGPGPAVYRITARGFCLGPASDLAGDARVILTSFDFAGRVEFEDDDRHAPVD